MDPQGYPGEDAFGRWIRRVGRSVRRRVHSLVIAALAGYVLVIIALAVAYSELIDWVVGATIILSPFIAVPMVIGYFVGRLIRDPMTAAVMSGLTYLTLFWSSLITALIVTLEGGEGAAVGAFVAIMLYVAFFVSLFFALALAFVTWNCRRRRIAAQEVSHECG